MAFLYGFCFDFRGGRLSWWFLVVVHLLQTGTGQDKDLSDLILALILKGPSDDVLWLPSCAQPSVDDTGKYVFDRWFVSHFMCDTNAIRRRTVECCGPYLQTRSG